jgi:hypothetical protein
MIFSLIRFEYDFANVRSDGFMQLAIALLFRRTVVAALTAVQDTRVKNCANFSFPLVLDMGPFCTETTLKAQLEVSPPRKRWRLALAVY